MKYVNAADVLPQELLMEVSKYSGGKLLYVPTSGEKKMVQSNTTLIETGR